MHPDYFLSLESGPPHDVKSRKNSDFYGARCATLSVRIDNSERDRFRSYVVCDTVMAGGALMPVAARAKAPDIEKLSIEERIERRAYELYIERGNQSGSELEDWLQAEEEVLQAQEDAKVPK
jgi:hypothetical protein